MLRFERQTWEKGFSRVAGVDEAGRGPLAGPVIAAAVVFDRSFVEVAAYQEFDGLTDSKKLSPSRRETFFAMLTESPAVRYGVGRAEAGEIDSLNILRATHLAMRRAVEALSVPPDHVLVDGLPVPGFPCASTSIVRGDAQSLSIAAASVIAKVTRDREMVELDRVYPQYHFAVHKGYGTRDHMQALFEFGPCPIHRVSFRPVRDSIGIRHRNEAAGSGGAQ